MSSNPDTQLLEILQHTVHIPDGATVIEASTFFTSCLAPNDTYTERLIVEVKGVRFCILRYDRDDSCILIGTGNEMQFISLDEVDGYIQKRTR